MAAMGHVAQRRAVFAGDQPPVLAAGITLAAGPREIGGGVLHADDVGDLRTAAPSSRREISTTVRPGML